MTGQLPDIQKCLDNSYVSLFLWGERAIGVINYPNKKAISGERNVITSKWFPLDLES